MEQTENGADETIETVVTPPPEPKAIHVRHAAPVAFRDGNIQLASLEDAFRLANAIHRSRLAPKSLDTPEKIMIGVMALYEVGLPIIMSLPKVCVINNAASFWGPLPLAIVKQKGKLEFIKEHFIAEDGSEVGHEDLDAPIKAAKCIVKMKDAPEPVVRVFSIEDARAAGLWKKTGPWTQYPKRMLQYRARSQALLDAAPEALYGVSILEYHHNITENEIKDLNPSHDANHIQSRVDELNREPIQ